MTEPPLDGERGRGALERLARLENESMAFAIEQVYRRRKRKIRSYAESGQQALNLTEPSKTIESEAPTSNPTCAVNWRNFPRVSLTRHGNTAGIYGILHRDTGRIYVGSSVNVAGRIRRHRYDLERKRHHSIKLQSAFDEYGPSHFDFLLIEEVYNLVDLVRREQSWMDQAEAYTKGFNSKSRAEGPEPSLPTHIESLKRTHFGGIYERSAPKREDFIPNDLDRQGFNADLQIALSRKIVQIAIGSLLAYVGALFPSTRLLWAALLFYPGIAVLFSWPRSPKQRAEWRYLQAEVDAKQHADAAMIQLIASRLSKPPQRIAEVYPLAEKTISRRRERSEYYRRRNFRLE